jgi:hypothetical protein
MDSEALCVLSSNRKLVNSFRFKISEPDGMVRNRLQATNHIKRIIKREGKMNYQIYCAIIIVNWSFSFKIIGRLRI